MSIYRVMGLTIIFIISGLGVVEATTYLDTTVPTQSLQTGSTQAPRLPKPAAPAVQSSQPPAAPISSDPKQGVAPAASAPPAPIAASQSQHDQGITLAPKTVLSMQALRELEAQLTTLNNQSAADKKMVTQRLAAMQGQILVLQAQQTALTKAVTILNQGLANIEQKLSLSHAGTTQLSGAGAGNTFSIHTLWLHIQQHLMLYLIVLLIILLGVLFLLILLRKRDPLVSKKEDRLVNQEYDFLGSPEGVAAKLDLARAYFAMQDYSQMRAILDEVRHKGDAEQKEAAEDLIKQIPSDT